MLPPLSQQEWQEAFEDYKQIPQYRELFPDMDLAGFKAIYAWEWAHRLLGRLIGVVFAVPLIWFWATGRLPRFGEAEARRHSRARARCRAASAGGWSPPASSIASEVAQERLAIHLVLAALIFSACLWVAGGLGPRPPLSCMTGQGGCGGLR